MPVNPMIHVSLMFFVVYLLISSTCNAQDIDTESHDVRRSEFPDNFLFGTAISSYQVEGGYLEDGKSLSNWDVFSHIPGNIKNNDNGDVADDDYHLYLEDAEIAHSLGVNAYRFSISWARILPRGKFGEVNPSGIKFYNQVIDNLLRRGIEPFVTMHHFDYPQELEDRYGGWLNPLMQEDFVLLAEICFKSFGDRVKYWITINEPNEFAEMAYIRGFYPPAHCSSPFGNCSAGNSDIEPLIVVHNMLLAHAKAVKLYREQFQPKQGGSIGLVMHSHMYEPLRDVESDRQAVNRALAFTGSWQDFVLFAKRCFKSFGDRVKYWTTINEPNMFAESAYVWGVYPPAHCSPPFGNCSVGNSDTESLIVVHNMLLAHAKAVKLYREQFQPKQGGSIGIVAHAHMFEPLRDVESDLQAVNRALAFMTGWIFDPLVFGDYPPEMRHYHRSELPRFSTEETEYLKGSIDFIGLNHYSTMYAKDCSYSSCALGGDHFIKGFVYTCGERDGIPIGEPTLVTKGFSLFQGAWR